MLCSLRNRHEAPTGAGKTFTACTFVYRLLKHADAHRILFLVDTRNLGEQAEQEFLKYHPTDDNRKFTELYNVQRLSSGYIASDSHVCISTIQRLYSILKGEELEESAEEANPNESAVSWHKKEPVPVEYSASNPIEQFDFIVIHLHDGPPQCLYGASVPDRAGPELTNITAHKPLRAVWGKPRNLPPD